MSIPMFFHAIKREDSILVDGGLYYNYPINLFDNKKYVLASKNYLPTQYDKTPGAVYNKETLGLRVDSIDEIAANKGEVSSPSKKIDSLKTYISALFEGLLEMANRVHLHKNDWHRTIYIENPGVTATEFNLSNKKKELLVKNGIEAVQAYFNWYDNPPKSEIPINK